MTRQTADDPDDTAENERQAYMSTGRVRNVYKDAVALLLEVGKTARAMEILELSRDAALKQMFDPTKIQTKDAKLKATLEKYAKTRARVQGLQKQAIRRWRRRSPSAANPR